MNSLRKISQILSWVYPNYKAILAFLIIVFVISGCIEAILITSISEFIRRDQNQISYILSIIGVQLNITTLLFIGLISNVFKLYVQWLIQYYIFEIHSKISIGIVDVWTEKKSSELLNTDLSQIQKQAISDAQTFTVNMCRTILNTLNGFIFSLFITLTMVFTSSFSTLGVVAFLIIVIFIFARLISQIIAKEGQIREASLKRRVSDIDLIINSMQVIKLGFWKNFNKSFSKATKSYSDAVRNQQFLSAVPKPLFESIIILIVMISVLLNLLGNSDDSLILLVPFAVAIYRMMPSLTLVYKGVIEITFYEDLITLFDNLFKFEKSQIVETRLRNQVRKIKLENLYLPYSKNSKRVGHAEFKYGSLNYIVGESGIGKTTLAYLISGLLDADNGKIKYYNAHNVEIQPSRTFFAGQKPIISESSLCENLSFDNSIVFSDLTNEMQILLRDFWTDNSESLGRFGSRLSTGQQQRLWVVKSLMTDASIVILDEPTANLDSLNRDLTIDAIKSVLSEKMVIIITHDRSIIRKNDTVLDLNLE